MSWNDVVGRMHDGVAETFGDPVVYRIAGTGTPREIVAIYDRAGVFVDPAKPGVESTSPRLIVRRSQLTADPRKRDTWTIDGVTIEVVEVFPEGRGSFVLRGMVSQ